MRKLRRKPCRKYGSECRCVPHPELAELCPQAIRMDEEAARRRAQRALRKQTERRTDNA